MEDVTTTVSEMKSTLKGNNSKLDITEEKFGEIKHNIAIETVQSETNKQGEGGNKLRINDM